MAQVRLEANVVFSSYVAFTSNATYVAIRLWGVAQLNSPLHLYLYYYYY